MGELITITRATDSGQFAALTTQQLLTLIRSASARIERYCRRPFAKTQRIDTINGDGTNSLFLRAFPVISVTSAVITDQMGITQTLTSAQLAFNALTGELRVLESTLSLLEYGYFPWGFQNIVVTYTAGFDPIPEDVQEACVHLMCWLQQNLTANQLIASKKIGDYEERYRVPRNARDADIAAEQEVPPVIRQILSAYKLVGI